MTSSPPEDDAHPHPLLPLLKTASRGRVALLFLVLVGAVALLYFVREVATPVLAAIGLAYVFSPAVRVLERRGIPRTAAVTALMIGIAVVGVGVIALVIPALVAQVGNLLEALPGYLMRASAWVSATLRVQIPTDAGEMLKGAFAGLQGLGPGALSKISAYALKIIVGGANALGAALSLVLVPVFTFFFLKDWEELGAKVMRLLPLPMQSPVAAKLAQIDRTLSAYLRGVLTVATLLAVLYSIALSILGVPLGLLIGVLAGYAYVVPFMSGLLGIGLGVLFSLLEFSGWGQVVGVVIIFSIGNMIEGFLLTPRIVGDSLGLPPIAVILAVMLGGSLFGFLGIMLALPAAAVANVVGRDLIELWQSSDLYKTGLRSS